MAKNAGFPAIFAYVAPNRIWRLYHSKPSILRFCLHPLGISNDRGACSAYLWNPCQASPRRRYRHNSRYSFPANSSPQRFRELRTQPPGSAFVEDPSARMLVWSWTRTKRLYVRGADLRGNIHAACRRVLTCLAHTKHRYCNDLLADDIGRFVC